MRIKVTYRGKQYPSISSCLRDYGIKTNSFNVYRRTALAQLSIDQALEVYIDKRLRKTQVTM